jgi:hypothetical protein
VRTSDRASSTNAAARSTSGARAPNWAAAGRNDGGGSIGAESTSTKRRRREVDERLPPALVEHGEPEREVVEQLVGDHDAVDQRSSGSSAHRLHTVGMASTR